MQFSINSLTTELQPLPDWDIHNYQPEHHEHLVQTHSGENSGRAPITNSRIPRSMNNISVEPIVNWIGTQLEGQSIRKTIESQLKGNHPGFPEGLLVLETPDKNTPRILVPKNVQHNLVT
jgi:hypothetical protein